MVGVTRFGFICVWSLTLSLAFRSVHNFDPDRQQSTKSRRGVTPSSYNAVGRLALGSDEFLCFCRDDPVEDLLASGVLSDWAPASRHSDDQDDDDEENEDADGGDNEEGEDQDGDEEAEDE